MKTKLPQRIVKDVQRKYGGSEKERSFKDDPLEEASGVWDSECKAARCEGTWKSLSIRPGRRRLML